MEESGNVVVGVTRELVGVWATLLGVGSAGAALKLLVAVVGVCVWYPLVALLDAGSIVLLFPVALLDAGGSLAGFEGTLLWVGVALGPSLSRFLVLMEGRGGRGGGGPGETPFLAGSGSGTVCGLAGRAGGNSSDKGGGAFLTGLLTSSLSFLLLATEGWTGGGSKLT